MAQALVAQLVVQCSNDSIALGSLYSDIQRGIQQPDVNFLTRILHLIVQSFQQTYIILDALDECSELDELINFIEEMCNWGVSDFRIIATSRQLSEIDETVGIRATDKLCLQDSKISTDILILVQHRLETDRKFQKWPAEVRDEIQNTLINGAHGM
jgi:hypothetical protein